MAPFPSPTAKWHDTAYPSISPTRPELTAKGKSVLITGGGTGIGAETAHSFARAGASRIALLGRRLQPLLDTKASIEAECKGVKVFTASTDVTRQDQVDAAFEQFIGKDKIDVIISNAAVTGPMDSVRDADVDALLAGVDMNVRSAMIVAKAAMRHAAPDAVVVNVSSLIAHSEMSGTFASYSIAKAAAFRLWYAVAFANPGWSVFHIQPGVVDTDMNRSAGGVQAMGFSDDASLPGSFNVWLASPEARFLKGRFLYANWDVDELKAREKEISAGQEFIFGLGGWPFGEPDWKFEISGDAPADSFFHKN